MMRHVFCPGCPTHPCRRELGRGDDFSLLGFGALSQGPEGGAGIHGAVSICRAQIQTRRLGCHGDTTGHRSDVVVPSWHRYYEPSLVAGNREREADASRPVVVPDSPP